MRNIFGCRAPIVGDSAEVPAHGESIAAEHTNEKRGNLESGGGVESKTGFKIRDSRDTQASEKQYESRKTWDGFRSRLPRAKVRGGLAGVATGPLDSFISFNQRYVLRLMVWTFLLGFAWATITWLARVTHGQNVVASGTNSVVWTNFTNFRVYTSNTAIRSNWVYQVVDSHARIDSNFEPVVVKTNGRWRITFKP